MRCWQFAFAVMMLAGHVAWAQPRSTVEDSADLFRRFDVNGDGMLSNAEIGVWSWARYDVNGDDVVSQSEFIGGRTADRGQAAVEPDVEKAWKLLDWNNDDMLSGTELDGKWSKYDTNGDGRVNKDEFKAGRLAEGLSSPNKPSASPLTPPAAPAPVGPAAAAPDAAWSNVNELKRGFSFAMPAEPTKDEQGTYMLVADNGNTIFKLTTGESDESLETESKQRLDAVRDAEVEAVKGKLISDRDSPLDGHPGRMFEARQDGDEKIEITYRVCLVGKRLIEMIVVRGAASTTNVTTIAKFFDSLKVTDKAANDKPGAAANEVTFASVVDAVAAADPTRLLAQMDPKLRAQVDYPLAHLMLDLIRNTLGQKTDAPFADVHTLATARGGVPGVNTDAIVTFERGTAKIMTTIQANQLYEFDIFCDKLGDLESKFFTMMAEDVDTYGNDFAVTYTPLCQNFFTLIFAGDDAAAYNLFPEEVRKQIPLEQAKAKFKQVRDTSGKLLKLEIEEFAVEPGTDGKPNKVKLSYLLTCSEGPAKATAIFQLAGMKAVLTGFDVAAAP